MAGFAARRSGGISVQEDYRASSTPREGLRPVLLPGFAPRLALRLCACVGAVALSACSVSFPLESMMPHDPVTTGSIGPVSPLAPELEFEDWRRARSAMAVALDPLGNGGRASWDNPETKRAGAFSATTRPFVQGDRICRGFSAELRLSAAESRAVAGSACRFSEGEWRIEKIDDNEAAKS
jgi:surface antigen